MVSREFGLDVLAFAPHPDDAELCVGGALLRMAGLGHRTGIVDLTRGEMSSNGTPETRAAETAAASQVLGLSVRENLGLPDTRLFPDWGYAAAWDDPGAGSAPRPSGDDQAIGDARAQIAAVVEVLRRLRPELVLIPWWGDRHPDHRAASELLTRALFFANLRKFESVPEREGFAPRQVLYYQLRERFRPSLIVDTSAVAQRKFEAARCYASQFGREAGATETLINSPLALATLEARDRYYGAMLGVTHGEPFFCRNTMGLVDPVAHFRQNDFPAPHLFEGGSA